MNSFILNLCRSSFFLSIIGVTWISWSQVTSSKLYYFGGLIMILIGIIGNLINDIRLEVLEKRLMEIKRC